MRVKPPERPEDITGQLVADLQAALGGELISVTLYGSAAAGRYRPGVSDLNLLVVAGQAAADRPGLLAAFARKWAPARVATPLVLTPAFLAGSRDTFPVELLAMAGARRVLSGPDPLAELAIDPAHLRLQLERELKAKLVTLRTRLIAAAGDDNALKRLTNEALPAFGALFQALARLESGQHPPDPVRALLLLAAQGLKLEAFAELMDLRQQDPKGLKGGVLMSLWEAALAQLAALCQHVDQIQAAPDADETT
ncbi:MAG: hypothetical protein V1797_19040 [Pseudomonadota bacterium]